MKGYRKIEWIKKLIIKIILKDNGDEDLLSFWINSGIIFPIQFFYNLVNLTKILKIFKSKIQKILYSLLIYIILLNKNFK